MNDQNFLVFPTVIFWSAVLLQENKQYCLATVKAPNVPSCPSTYMFWLPFLCPAQGSHLNCVTSSCLAHNHLLYLSKFASNKSRLTHNNLVPNCGLEKHKSMLLPIMITNFPPSAQFNCWTITLLFPKRKSYYHSQDTGCCLRDSFVKDQFCTLTKSY